MTGDDASMPVGAGATAWTTGRITTKDLPAPHLVRLRMDVEDRQCHRRGQHYLIRLRAPDASTAQRSYSVASDDSDPLVEFLIERLPSGEVSDFLADVAPRSATCWRCGGTGVVPAIAMIRAAQRLGRPDRLRVMAVARGPKSCRTPRSSRRRERPSPHPSFDERPSAGSADRGRGRLTPRVSDVC